MKVTESCNINNSWNRVNYPSWKELASTLTPKKEYLCRCLTNAMQISCSNILPSHSIANGYCKKQTDIKTKGVQLRNLIHTMIKAVTIIFINSITHSQKNCNKFTQINYYVSPNAVKWILNFLKEHNPFNPFSVDQKKSYYELHWKQPSHELT